MLAKLALVGQSVEHYTLHNGLIRYKGKIVIGNKPQLHNKLIAAMHDSAVGGHSDILVTIRKLKQLFHWKGMNTAVHQYVKTCAICQQAKPERVKYPGLLQPLAVPEQAWQVVTLDFIEGLPTSASANCILVTIDNWSKYAHFIPLKHPFSAFSVAVAFVFNVYKLHGLP